MKSYIMSLITVALVAAVIEIFSPKRVEKHMKLIVTLCVVCVMIQPFASVVSALYGLSSSDLPFYAGEESREEYESIMRNTVLSAGRENLEQGIRKILYEKFEIPYNECRVSANVEYADEKMTVKRVTLVLNGSSIWRDPYEIEEYISELLGCECVTAIE